MNKKSRTQPNQRLQAERLRRRWSQRELAGRLGTTFVSVSRWEQGITSPNLYFRHQLCAVFGKSAAELGFTQEEADDEEERKPLPIGGCQEVSSPPPDGFSRIWSVPFHRNPFFTGREAVLTRLYDLLHAKDAGALIHSLNGLSGIGKTQTAVEYAYRYGKDYRAVLWVRAETSETLLSDFTELADLLQVVRKDQQDQHQLAKAVIAWLNAHTDWLLVLDNVENVTLARDFTPSAPSGHVLLTTRARSLGPLARPVYLKPMEPEEGIYFLLRRAGYLPHDVSLSKASVTDYAAAEDIYRLMDGLPLALDQAGAYIEATQCSLTDYLQLLQSSPSRLLKEREETHDHPVSVTRTFALAFEQLERDHPAAGGLLTSCAFLAPEPIPDVLFLSGGAWLGPAFETFADPCQFHDALKTLLAYSLLQRDPDTHTVTIHRLVQTVLRGYLPVEEQRAWTVRMISVLVQFFSREEHLHVDYWQTCTRLLPHALACIEQGMQWLCPVVELIALMSQVAVYLSRSARFSEAESLLQRAICLGEQVLEPEHPLMADLLYRLGFHYNLQGRYHEATPFYERALQIAGGNGGAEHPLLAEIMTGLAGRYRELGRYQEAEPLFLRALRLTENAPAPRAAFHLQGLATLYEYQGRYVEAEPLYRRALQMREQTFGREHPQVAGLLHDLGFVCVKQGKDEQGEALLHCALSIFEQTVGPDHTYVTYPLSILAELQVAKGNDEEAERLYQRTLMLRQQQWGPQHPLVAETLHDLGCFRLARQQKQEALALFRQALTIRQRTLGVDHPKTRETERFLQELGNR